MSRFIDNSEALVRQLNDILQSRSGSVVNIINDKLTVSVFSLLADNLARVGKINFVLRDPRTIPSEREVAREFDLAADPNDVLFNQYDIMEKNKLRHFADARAMHDFIQRHVAVRRTCPGARIAGNVLLIDNDFMIAGSSSLELARKYVRGAPAAVHFDALVSHDMDPAQIVEARKRFDRVWHTPEMTEDYKDELLARLRYVYKEHAPAFLYYFTLHDVFADRLDATFERIDRDAGRFKETPIWKKLYTFQKDAVLSALQKLHNHGGCIIADSVGLGKTFEALAVIKYFELRNDNVLVLSPAKLFQNWQSFRGDYKDNPVGDRFNYKIMFHTDLSRYGGESRTGMDLSRFDWSRFDLIVIDESHNFRNRTERDDGFTRYQRLLEEVIRHGQHTKVLLLSATPVNNSLVDLKNQISLITGDRDDAFIEDGIDSVDNTLRRATTLLNHWGNAPERRKAALFDKLPSDFYRLLEMLTISRSRRHITQYYGGDDMGAFPEKRKPITFTPEIDRDGELLRFAETNEILESLNLSVYTPMAYIKAKFKQLYREKYQTLYRGKATFYQENREVSLRVLHRFNLFKRMESSVYSFGETVRRLLGHIDDVLRRLGVGGELAEAAAEDERDMEDGADLALGALKINVAHLNAADYRRDLEYDKSLLERLLSDIDKVLAEGRDKKLAELLAFSRQKIIDTPYNPGNRKILVFTAFADTADYLYRQLGDTFKPMNLHVGFVSGSRPARTTHPEVVAEFGNLLSAFAPRARLERDIPAKDQLTLLVGTDCISEGQNLQDCDCVVNYDIHWNPVRLIQRFGRIDRIGSPNQYIQMVNFFPHLKLNEYLRLEQRIKGKMLAVNVASTGDEDLLSPEMNDYHFRVKQLERLKEEVVDLDEAQENLSLADLNLNDYLYELSSYLKTHPELRNVPRGIYAVTDATVADGPVAEPGVIFCFKHRSHDGRPESDSSLYPYYLLYMRRDGTVLHGNDATRETLKRFRALCRNKDHPFDDLARAFLAETKDAKDMSFYSDLLSKGIQSIREGEESNAEQSVLDFGGFNNPFALDTRDDFELVSFLVIR